MNALVGARLAGVFWSLSKESGYSHFFVNTVDGRWFELTHQGVLRTSRPTDANDFTAWLRGQGWSSYRLTPEGPVPSAEPNPNHVQADRFQAILGTAGVVDVRGDQGDVCILMDSGAVLHLFLTWNGESGGNNLIVDPTDDAAGWADEFHLMPRLE